MYTKSVPDLSAAIDANIGAPWYILFPPTTSIIPLSPFLDEIFLDTKFFVIVLSFMDINSKEFNI